MTDINWMRLFIVTLPLTTASVIVVAMLGALAIWRLMREKRLRVTLGLDFSMWLVGVTVFQKRLYMGSLPELIGGKAHSHVDLTVVALHPLPVVKLIIVHQSQPIEPKPTSEQGPHSIQEYISQKAREN